MNAKVHPAIAALVIGLAVLALGLWIWAGGKAREFGGPSQLVTNPSGRLFVQIGNQLLEHDRDGRFVARHDLSELETATLIGGIAFFAGGDLLLRRGEDPRSVMDNLRAFARDANTRSLRPDKPDTGLYRCKLAAGSCTPFGDGPIDPGAAFSVHIDSAGGRVYLSDTSRHVLRMFTLDGQPAADPAHGFRFPNGLAVAGGKLYVADTNAHRIAVVDVRTGNFGDLTESIDVVPDEARAAGHRWPTRIARVGDNWWVNNMDNRMQYGGVYVFDADWRYSHRVELPDGADPIDIQAANGEVLVSDWFNDRIHRVSTNGEWLGHFTSPGIENLLEVYRQKRFRYTALSYSGVVLVALVFLLLILRFAIDATKTPPKHVNVARPAKSVPDTVEYSLFPDPQEINRIQRQLRLLGLAFGVIAVAVAIKFAFSAIPALSVLLLLPIAGLIVIIRIIGATTRAHGKTSIHVQGEYLVLEDMRGRRSRAPLSEVVYNRRIVATPDAAIFLGQPKMQIYKPETLESELFPRLGAAREISPWQMQRHIMALRPRQAILVVALLVAMLIVTIVASQYLPPA